MQDGGGRLAMHVLYTLVEPAVHHALMVGMGPAEIQHCVDLACAAAQRQMGMDLQESAQALGIDPEELRSLYDTLRHDPFGASSCRQLLSSDDASCVRDLRDGMGLVCEFVRQLFMREAREGMVRVIRLRVLPQHIQHLSGLYTHKIRPACDQLDTTARELDESGLEDQPPSESVVVLFAWAPIDSCG